MARSSNYRKWTEEELKALRDNYESVGPSWPMWEILLPGRNYAQIVNKASDLGIKTRSNYQRVRWTEYEDRVLVAALVRLSERLDRSPLALARHLETLARSADSRMRLLRMERAED